MTPAPSNSSEKRTLFLARGRDAGYGYVWPEEIIDGPHSQPAGVARAADLHRRLFDDDSPFVMVETHNLSDGTSEGKDR